MTQQATKKPAAKKTTKAKAAAKTTKATKTRTVVVVDAEKAAPKRTGAGRPSSYKPEYADLCFKFALLGASDARMAELLGVCEATFHNWKLEHPEFLESLMAGKERADAEIAHSLFHRAKGYSHPEDDIRTLSIGQGMSEIVITPTVKHYPPDTGAATLWLKNRQKHLWRDKVDVGLENPDGSPLDLNLNVTFVTPKTQG